MDLPSAILQQAVDQLRTLPGVGARTALRYALHLVQGTEQEARDLADSLLALKTELHHCRLCHNIADSDLCPVCASPKRQRGILCVVENVQGVMAVEATGQYNGLYHVLGGVISPIDGVGINDLELASLTDRVRRADPEPVTEVILALPATMEGDTTAYYIYRQLSPLGVKVTAIARGVSVGDSLEYADEATLGRSIVGRRPFNSEG
ncbi:MAG: recombination mediator RecR [Bacteroidales bacterium]|nr:recombination mediator RecR [Bacteroidales bacterium]